jgi:hypothetical protein
MVARALFVVHNCIYDAWAAYDRTAEGVRSAAFVGQNRRGREQEPGHQLRCLPRRGGLIYDDKAQCFDPLMASLGYDIMTTRRTLTTATGIGNVTCKAILGIRQNDESKPTRQPDHKRGSICRLHWLQPPILQLRFRSGLRTITPALTLIAGGSSLISTVWRW